MPKLIPGNQDEKLRSVNGNFLDAIKKVETKTEDKFKSKQTPKTNKLNK